MSTEVKSSRGAARSSAITSPSRLSISSEAARIRSGSAPWNSVSVQERMSPRCFSGTPNSSQMIVIGIGRANSETRSAEPFGAMVSSRSSTMRLIHGRSASTRRGVNADASADRSRVWSGGSEDRMLRRAATATSPVKGSSPALNARQCSTPLAIRWSVSASRATSYRVTSHAGIPPLITIGTTGAASRRSANRWCGSATNSSVSSRAGSGGDCSGMVLLVTGWVVGTLCRARRARARRRLRHPLRAR